MYLTRSLLSILCLSAGAPALAADEAKEAQALLGRALKAMGGEKALKKYPALTGKSRGSVTLMGKKSPATNEWTAQGLDQLKWSAEVELNDKPTTFVVVLGGGKGWIQANAGKTNALPKETLTAFQHAFAGLRVAEHPVLLLEKGWKLSPLGEVKVDGKPAVGVKASRKGLPDLDLYFDKKTSLPVQAEMRVQEAGVEVAYKGLLADYKTFAGRKCFTKLTLLRDGERTLEMERSDIKPLERQDDDTFGKP